MGLTATSLSHKVSPTYVTANLSPNELMQVMKLTGDHAAYFAMSVELGYAPMPLPQPGDDADEAFNTLMTKSIKEYGESMQAASAAHQSPSNRSLETYQKELLDSMLAGLSVLSSLKARNTAANPTPTRL